MADISIIGVPMDLGASRRGVDMGPSAFRIARLGERLTALGHQVIDRGNLSVSVRESITEKEPKCKYKEEIAEVAQNLAQMTYRILKEQQFPLILGGDHSIAIGSVAGISKYYREKGEKIGLIWLDAHADINTPDTTLTGNIHGMPLAHILGLGSQKLLSISDALPMVEPARVVLIGARDVDPAEKVTLKKVGIKVFTMRDIDERGLREVMLEAIRIASSETIGFHVSFDVDCVDPSVAPGVGTPVPGGITYREAHLAMELVCDSHKMLSLEMTEVNPVLDVANKTAHLATEMILSALGKRIL